jgi:hypothetical protein
MYGQFSLSDNSEIIEEWLVETQILINLKRMKKSEIIFNKI